MAVSLTSPPALRGRGDQAAQLDGLLDRARAGHSGVLMLSGEAGVGKTALLDYVIASASASALTVVRVAGIESEMELAFAALQQLCGPMLDRLERVPARQRNALETAFGVGAGEVPDRFLVGLAMMSLLSEVSQERPLLCVIDDAQWLDQASAQALAFVARRVLAEPVVMLFAAREPSDLLTGLPALALAGIADADARALLSSVVPGRLDRRIAQQIIVETRGNPLALLELPRGLSAGQLAGGFGLPGALSLSGRIESSFSRRLEALPEDTRRLLLVAAAEPTGDPALLWRAAERLTIDPRALEPAESDRLIDVDHRVRFRHPLVRSALYRGATPQERRAAHRALADATDARVDPDRRAWHLAVATAGANEAIATELERAAARAHAVEAWPPPPRSRSARSGSQPSHHSAHSGPLPRRRRSTRRARSMTQSPSWTSPTPLHSKGPPTQCVRQAQHRFAPPTPRRTAHTSIPPPAAVIALRHPRHRERETQPQRAPTPASRAEGRLRAAA